MNLSDQDLDRVARLIDAAHAALDAGEELDHDALAQRFGLDGDVIGRCIAAAGAFATALEEDHVPAREIPVPPLPADYEVRGELGRGGMGIVYRVHQKSLDRDVALKVLRPGDMMFGGAIQRFEREARSLARLRHRHIVSVHEVGDAGGFVYYTMDLVEGRTLAELITDGKVTVAQAVRLLRQVAAAVGYAHSQGIVHRDLKPANILVDREGDAFVVDFGLARDSAAGGAGVTLSGQLLGTPTYMSPEQVAGDTDRIGEASDIYALGTILYECLAGRGPFADLPLVQLMRAILEEPVPPLRRVAPRTPRDLEVICAKAMARRPADRYATAQALVDDLERFAGGQPIVARSPSRVVSAGRALWRRRRQLGRVAATVGIALVVAWVWLLPRALISDSISRAGALLAAGDSAGALTLYRSEAERRTRGDLGDIDPALALGYARALNAEAARVLLAGDAEAAARLLSGGLGYPDPCADPDLGFERLRAASITGCATGLGFVDVEASHRTRLEAALGRPRVLDADLLLFATAIGTVSGFLSPDRGRELFAQLLERTGRASGLSMWVMLMPLVSEATILARSPGRVLGWLLDRRDERFEALLVQKLSVETTEPVTRGCLLAILSAISDRHPVRVRYEYDREPRSADLVAAMDDADYAHLVRVWRATQSLPRVEAFKERLRMYADLLPRDEAERAEFAVSTGPQPVPPDAKPILRYWPLDGWTATAPGRYRLESWYLDHTGMRIGTRAEWEAFWREHGDEDPRWWFLRALGWGADPGRLTPAEILRRCADPHDPWSRTEGAAQQRVWRHHLLELTITGARAPLRAGAVSGTTATGIADWARVLKWSPSGARHVRVASLALTDGDPRPRLLWERRLRLAVGEEQSVAYEGAEAVRRRSLRFAWRPCGRRTEDLAGRRPGPADGAIPASDLPPDLGEVLRLMWDGSMAGAEARAATRWSRWRDGRGNFRGTLRPGIPSFGEVATEVDASSGQVVRLLTVRLLEGEDSGTAPWTAEDWLGALRRSVEALSRVADPDQGTREAILNLIGGLAVLPVPGLEPPTVRRFVFQLGQEFGSPAQVGEQEALAARALHDDPDALGGLQRIVAVRQGTPAHLDWAARLLLVSRRADVRAYAVDRLRGGALTPGIARSLRAAVDRTDAGLPEWLTRKLDAIGEPGWLDVLGDDPAVWSLLGGLLLGGLGLCLRPRHGATRRGAALVLALTAGCLANASVTLMPDGGSIGELVPTWVSLGLVAGALWIALWRTTVGLSWVLCPAWWTCHALLDAGLRVAVGHTAPGWVFWVGCGWFLVASIAALVTRATRPGRIPESGRTPGG